MSQTPPTPNDMLSQGIADDRNYDINMPIPQANQPAPEAMKEVKLKFPPTIPDEMIVTACKLGLQIIHKCQKQVATLSFVQTSVNDGKVGWSIGTIEMGCLDENDIKRVTTLINEINRANTTMMAAAQKGQQSDIASAMLAGTQAKDNALDAMMKQGKPEPKQTIIEP